MTPNVLKCCEKGSGMAVSKEETLSSLNSDGKLRAERSVSVK